MIHHNVCVWFFFFKFLDIFEALGEEVFCQIDFQNFQAKSRIERKLLLHE